MVEIVNLDLVGGTTRRTVAGDIPSALAYRAEEMYISAKTTYPLVAKVPFAGLIEWYGPLIVIFTVLDMYALGVVFWLWAVFC